MFEGYYMYVRINATIDTIYDATRIKRLLSGLPRGKNKNGSSRTPIKKEKSSMIQTKEDKHSPQPQCAVLMQRCTS